MTPPCSSGLCLSDLRLFRSGSVIDRNDCLRAAENPQVQKPYLSYRALGITFCRNGTHLPLMPLATDCILS